MNTITIEKQDLTVETLTIPDDQIGAVMAELTERFGKRDGFVKGQEVWVLGGDGVLDTEYFNPNLAGYNIRGRIFHTKAEAVAKDERRLAEQRLRKAYLAVTGGAEIEGEHYVPYLYNNKTWGSVCHNIAAEPHPYRFATAEQAAAFGRDNGEDLIRMQTV